MQLIRIRALTICKRALISAWTVLTFTYGHDTVAGPVNPPCSEISGRFVFTAFTFLNGEGTEATGDAEIWIDGKLVGHAHAHYFIDRKGNGVNQATFSHDWTFLDGSTIHSEDQGVVLLDSKNPGWGRINSRLHLVSGTALLAGATGLVHTHGEANLFTLEGGIDFKGQICLPE